MRVPSIIKIFLIKIFKGYLYFQALKILPPSNPIHHCDSSLLFTGCFIPAQCNRRMEVTMIFSVLPCFYRVSVVAMRVIYLWIVCDAFIWTLKNPCVPRASFTLKKLQYITDRKVWQRVKPSNIAT